MNKDLKDYKYIIYDFEGTLAKLDIDWAPWHVEVRKVMLEFEPTFDVNRLVHTFQNDFVKKYGPEFRRKVWEITRDFERTAVKSCIPNLELIDFIRANPQIEHSILSSQSREALDKLLKELEIEKLFKTIISRDDTYYIKPDTEGILKLIGGRNKADFCYLGDSAWDEAVAKAVGVDFEYVKL